MGRIGRDVLCKDKWRDCGAVIRSELAHKAKLKISFARQRHFDIYKAYTN